MKKMNAISNAQKCKQTILKMKQSTWEQQQLNETTPTFSFAFAIG